MRLIDCHAHLWHSGHGFGWIKPGSAHDKTFTVSDLDRSGDGLDLAGSILVEASRGDRGETLALRELRLTRPDLVAGYVGNLKVYEGIAPSAFARLLTEAGPNGMRLGGPGLPEPHETRLLPVLAELGVTLDLNLLTDALGAAAALAQAHPGLTVVVNHLGNPPNLRTGDLTEWERGLRLAAREPGVLLKISGLLTQQNGVPLERVAKLVERAVDAVGPERCLVGSDWPICLPRGSRADSLELACSGLARLTADERALVLHGTAVRAYRLAGNLLEGTNVIDTC
ncbi:amidohydrolase family protein [Kribbella sp. NPDC054772]